MNEDHRGVGFVHSTDESSNDAGGKGRTISCFCNQSIESTGGIKSMEKEKTTIIHKVMTLIGTVLCIILIPIIILVVFAIVGYNYIQDNDINIEDCSWDKIF